MRSPLEADGIPLVHEALNWYPPTHRSSAKILNERCWHTFRTPKRTMRRATDSVRLHRSTAGSPLALSDTLGHSWERDKCELECPLHAQKAFAQLHLQLFCTLLHRLDF